MTTASRTFTRTLALMAALLAALPAQAVLRDHGPSDPTLVWPQWYRDLNGTVLGLCKSQVVDANVGASYCFPLAPNPAGFAGNLGDEIFYSNLSVDVQGSNAFTLLYEAALEAAYIPGPNPTHGQEVVFSRIRFLMNNPVPGTYTVIHPYGVQVFPDVETTGKRSVFFTVDLPPGIPGDFNGALSGDIGPFPQTAVVDALGNVTPTLVTLTNPATGTTETFLGDGNTPTLFVGSPFDTNFVRVIGPPGSGIGGTDPVTGLPIDTVEQHLGVVLGQVWTAPIPTPFAVQRATYSRTALYNGIDVWAQSAPGQNLVVTGTSLPTTRLAELPGGTGQYYAHVQQDAAGAPPALVTVTNYSSPALSSSSIQVTDAVTATATFDPVDRTLTVLASSSDLSGPGLVVLGPGGGAMTPGAAGSGAASFTSGAYPADVAPPRTVSVQSEAGGNHTANVWIGQVAGVNGNALVANDDILADFDSVGTIVIDAMLNDTNAFGGAPAGATIRIVTQGTKGSAVGGASIAYTPLPGASGLETITYLLESADGFSNVATVEFNLLFVAPPPTVGADSFAVRTGVAKLLNVLANDSAAAGTTLDPASILENGANATPNAAGQISYLAPTTTTASFAYTVANTAGTRSNPATVTVVSFGVNEQITIRRADYTTASKTWRIDGGTNWFSTALTQQKITCWLGTALAPTASTLIGTAPIDTAGGFAVVTTTAGPTPTPAGQRVSCQSTGGAIGTLSSRNR